MKKWLICLALATFSTSAYAQNDHSVGDRFLESGYVDEADALTTQPDSVLYIDLALQTPKLTAIPQAVYGCTNVREIDVSYNRVAGIGPEIAALTHLEFLDLSGNHYLTSISDEIGKCKHLKFILLKETGLKQAQVDHLKTLLPETCQIIN